MSVCRSAESERCYSFAATISTLESSSPSAEAKLENVYGEFGGYEIAWYFAFYKTLRHIFPSPLHNVSRIMRNHQMAHLEAEFGPAALQITT